MMAVYHGVVQGDPENTCIVIVHLYECAKYDTLIASYLWYLWCQSPGEHPTEER